MMKQHFPGLCIHVQPGVQEKKRLFFFLLPLLLLYSLLFQVLGKEELEFPWESGQSLQKSLEI